jgi:hypothetical protein
MFGPARLEVASVAHDQACPQDQLKPAPRLRHARSNVASGPARCGGEVSGISSHHSVGHIRSRTLRYRPPPADTPRLSPPGHRHQPSAAPPDSEARGLGRLLNVTVANGAGGWGLPGRMVGAGEPLADE